MNQDVQRAIQKDLVFVAETKMKKGLAGVYREIRQDCLLSSYERMPHAIAGAEAARLPVYVGTLQNEMKTQLGLALDACGISRNRAQVIWMSAMSKVPMPKLGLCKVKPMEAPSAPSISEDDFKRYKHMEAGFAGSAAAAGAGVAFMIAGHWFLVPGICLTAAGACGMIYSGFRKNQLSPISDPKAKLQSNLAGGAVGLGALATGTGVGMLFNSPFTVIPAALAALGVAGMAGGLVAEHKIDLISAQNAQPTQPSAEEISQFVDGVIEGQRQLNEHTLAAWIRRVADALAAECEAVLARM